MVLENIAMVRQIVECLEGGEFRADLLALLKGFQTRIPGFFPDLSWKRLRINSASLELLMVPDGAWEVVDDRR